MQSTCRRCHMQSIDRALGWRSRCGSTIPLPCPQQYPLTLQRCQSLTPPRQRKWWYSECNTESSTTRRHRSRSCPEHKSKCSQWCPPRKQSRWSRPQSPRWSWRPVALQTPQTEFDSLLALIEGSTLYQMCYTHRWTSRGSYQLISDRTCGKKLRWWNGRHAWLRIKILRVRIPPGVQIYT